MTRSASRFGPLAISFTFVAAGALWIGLSDRAILAIAQGDPELLTTLSTAKGWISILASGLLLWGLIARRERAIVCQANLLASILDNIGDVVIVVQGSGRIVAMNPAAEQLFGPARTMAELHGWYQRDGTSPLPDDEQPLIRGLRGEPTSQELVTVRNERLPRGGTYSVTGRPQRGPRGEVRGAVVALHDVTALKRAEERLRASEELFHTVARLAPVVIFRNDRSGRCIYVNETWVELTGMPTTAALGDGWAEGIHHDDRDVVLRGWAQSVRTRSGFRAEYRLHTPDGRIRWMLAQVSPEVDGTGEVVGFVGTLTDITERKAAHDETRRLAEELERRVSERTAQLEASSRELDSFAYSVSHDLRAPLRTISGFAQMVLEEAEEALSERSRVHLRRVILASRRMGEIIDGLLNLARVTRSQLRGEWVDISAIGESVLEDLRGEDPARDVDARVEPGIRVWGDPTLLRIALENLLRNAWKFTKDAPHARIVVERGEGGAVAVRDNGAGFDMAWAGRLFRAFERLHPTDAFPGSGIGLATVHRIVTRHGGRIWAEGEVGKGATFWFTVADGPAEEPVEEAGGAPEDRAP